MEITDAQVHIWAAETPDRPWIEGGAARAQRPVPLEVDELVHEMDGAGVDRVVLVPPSWEGDRNDVALGAVAKHPDRLAIMGRINLREPDAVDLSHWLEQPGMLGIRLSFTYYLAEQLNDGSANWFWPAAEEAGVPIMFFAPGFTPEIGEIARRHPGLRILVDHCNLATTLRDDEIGPAIDPLIDLAELDNVAVKVSAFPCLISESFPFTSAQGHIRRVVDAFGKERAMWGSDLSRLPCPYGEWVRAITETNFLSASEVEWVMGRAVSEWLNWPSR